MKGLKKIAAGIAVAAMFVSVLPMASAEVIQAKADDFSLEESVYEGAAGKTYWPRGLNILTEWKLGEDTSCTSGVSGLGKGGQDRFIGLTGSGKWQAAYLAGYPNITASAGNYCVFVSQVYFNNDSGRFQIGAKVNGSWLSTQPFDITGTTAVTAAGNAEIELNKWNTFAVVFKSGESSYDVYINDKKIGSAELASAFTKFNSINMVQNRMVTTYIDNVSVYETDTPYGNEQNTSVSSTQYTVENNTVTVPAVNRTTVNELLRGITIPDGASANVGLKKLGSSEMLSGTDIIGTDYKLFVTAADGITIGEYNIKGTEDIINLYEEDCSNITDGEGNSFSVINKDSKRRWDSYYYAIESYVMAVRYNEADKSYLANGDYVELVTGGTGKKADDKYIKVFADVSDTKKMIELNKQSNDGKYNKFSKLNTLNDDYNLVVEFDIRSDNPSMPVQFSLKLSDGTNTGWSDNARFSFGWGKLNNTVNSNNWYHMAVVFHKGTNQYSIYEDGNIIVDHDVLKINGTEAVQKPVSLKTVNFKIINTKDQTASVCFDNIRYYEKYSDYDYDVSKSDIDSSVYECSNTDRVVVGDFNGSSVSGFLNNIVLPDGASAVVYNTDEKTEASEIGNGMKLAVYPADGLSVKLYTLYSDILSSITFYNADGDVVDKPEGTAVTAKISLNIPRKGDAYLAVYDNAGILQKVAMSSDNARNFVVSLEGLTDLTDCTAKVFLWDSGAMTPIIN